MSDVNPCISEDIWFEIFKELPVKTLGKCRCVCKSWRSLIVSPSFMAAHLKHYTQNTDNSLILYKKKSENRCYEQCVLFRDSAQLKVGYSSLHTSTFPVMILDEMWAHLHLLGSVYGLLCLSDHDDRILPSTSIYIWNPIIQQSMELPKTTVRDRKSSVVGFGYDCRKNDHRVVRIFLSDVLTPLVEVFSVQERTQRILFADYLDDNFITDISSVNCFVNGVIHWFIRDTQIRPRCPKTLLMFNVSDENFDMMELPESIINIRESTNDRNLGIFEYQGMLSVSFYCPLVRCQIWVKREYNDASSWCKILDVIPSPGIYRTGPVQYLGKNGELLGFARKHRERLVLYDTRSDHIKELSFRISSSTEFSTYSESLVFLDQEIPLQIDEYAILKWLLRCVDDRDLSQMARALKKIKQ